MATRKTTPAAKAPLQVETLKHEGDKRKNIPTAEYQAVVQREHTQPVQVRYDRQSADRITPPEAAEAAPQPQGAPGPLAAERNARNRDLDPG